jgi:hypothetical protein
MKQRRPCKDADREDLRVLFNRGKKEEDLKKRERKGKRRDEMRKRSNRTQKPALIPRLTVTS